MMYEIDGNLMQLIVWFMQEATIKECDLQKAKQIVALQNGLQAAINTFDAKQKAAQEAQQKAQKQTKEKDNAITEEQKQESV